MTHPLFVYRIVIQILSSRSRAASMALMSRCSQMREFTTMPWSLFSPTRMQPCVSSELLAVAIQLNVHANKAESPILQHQAYELDNKSPHISQVLFVRNVVLCRSFLSRGRQNLFALTILLVQANARRAIREYTLRGQLVSDFLRFYFLFLYLFYRLVIDPQ